MINLEYHKGQSCPHKEITCQEGYCSGCIIYLEKSFLIRPLTFEKAHFIRIDKARRKSPPYKLVRAVDHKNLCLPFAE